MISRSCRPHSSGKGVHTPQTCADTPTGTSCVHEAPANEGHAGGTGVLSGLLPPTFGLPTVASGVPDVPT
eukprot:12663157-Alexandrium_andersonii.AAC.1